MAKQIKGVSQSKRVVWEFPYEKQNFLLFAAGLGTIILGYVLMATGITDDPAKYQSTWDNVLATSVAPAVLVLGYCVIVPMAIYRSFKTKSE